MNLIRTKKDGVWASRTSSWGSFYTPVEDPSADSNLTYNQLVNTFSIKDTVPPIPEELWHSIIDFYYYWTVRKQEAQVLLLRALDSSLPPWKVVVPRQQVTAASVETKDFNQACDLITGEPIESWPPEGYTPAGSSHSHNSMACSWSYTDDKHELPNPGLH